jgi:ABC-type multidrug transport system fused ATPase/permease subunit
VRDQPHARRAAAFKGRIEFKNVSFAYSPEQKILEDVSFTIEPQGAFVGPTGREDHDHQPDRALLRSRLRDGHD